MTPPPSLPAPATPAPLHGAGLPPAAGAGLPADDAAALTPARRRLLALWHEQAITLTLLEVPEFRRKAGLPPRQGGSTLEEMGRVLGVCRERVRAVEQTALRKLRRLACTDKDLQR